MQRNRYDVTASPSKLGDVIEEIILKDPLLGANPFGNWADIVGDVVAKYSKPVKYDRGKLTVYVFDSVWKHHLMLSKEELISRINNISGRSVIKDIIFKVGEIEKETVAAFSLEDSRKLKRKKKASTRKGRKVPKYRLTEESKKFISSLKDSELKMIARRFLRLFPP